MRKTPRSDFPTGPVPGPTNLLIRKHLPNRDVTFSQAHYSRQPTDKPTNRTVTAPTRDQPTSRHLVVCARRVARHRPATHAHRIGNLGGRVARSVGLVTPQPTSSYGISANFALRAGVTVGKLGGRTFPGAGPTDQPTWAWGYVSFPPNPSCKGLPCGQSSLCRAPLLGL